MKVLTLKGMKDLEHIGAIEVTRNTRASGKSMVKGEEYQIPGDVSLKDAWYLVKIGKAKPVEKDAPVAELNAAERLDKVIEAIRGLDDENDDNFTNAGDVKLDVLSEAVGFKVTSDERAAALEEVKEA